MKITPKSPEQIQAQVADFAQESVENSGYFKGNERRQIFQGMGKLAAGAIADYTYTREHEDMLGTKRWTDEYTIPAGQYVSHLRRTGGARNERVQARTQYQQAYEQMRPVIGNMVRQLTDDAVDRTSHESFVGKGSNAAAFGFEIDGKKYVAKIAHGKEDNAFRSDERFLDLVPGKGIPHLEQLAAISYEDGVAVMERMPGTDMFHTPAESADQATTDQLEDAITAMRAAHAAGIVFDPKASNYMYDPKEGFGFIDYMPQGPPETAQQQTLAQKMEYFVNGLAHVGTPQVAIPKTKADYLNNAANAEVSLRLLEKYRVVCAAQPDAETFAGTLAEIDEQVAHKQQLITNVATPGWIEMQFAEEAARKQRMREQAEQDRIRVENGEDDFV